MTAPWKIRTCCRTAATSASPSSCAAGEPFESLRAACTAVAAASRAVPPVRSTATSTRAHCHLLPARACAQMDWAAPSAGIAQTSKVSDPARTVGQPSRMIDGQWRLLPLSHRSSISRLCPTVLHRMCCSSVSSSVFTDTRASVRHAADWRRPRCSQRAGCADGSPAAPYTIVFSMFDCAWTFPADAPAARECTLSAQN